MLRLGHCDRHSLAIRFPFSVIAGLVVPEESLRTFIKPADIAARPPAPVLALQRHVPPLPVENQLVPGEVEADRAEPMKVVLCFNV
jgi:hypothetical protein